MTHHTPALSPQALTKICDDLLNPDVFDDYCPNGLQIDGGQAISHIVTGVTACQALIDRAIAVQAQAIIVHHGYFWKGESQPLTDMKGKRIRTLLQNGISLLAYHLPLDAHTTLGNNALLAQALELQITGALYPKERHPIGNMATCTPISARDFAQKITTVLGRAPLHLGDGDKILRNVALCTGAAQDMLTQAYKMGADAFISGEVSERTTHEARELGVHYFACGHHATETFGVRALSDWLTREHKLSCEFIDINNPV